MLQVREYELCFGADARATVAMPAGSTILSVQRCAPQRILLWALESLDLPNVPVIPRAFHAVETGQPVALDDDDEPKAGMQVCTRMHGDSAYVGTVQLELGKRVIHVFVEPEPPPPRERPALGEDHERPQLGGG